MPSNPEVLGRNGAANTRPQATRVKTKWALIVALVEFCSDKDVAVEICFSIAFPLCANGLAGSGVVVAGMSRLYSSVLFFTVLFLNCISVKSRA